MTPPVAPPVSVTMTTAQTAVFTELAAREREAQAVLSNIAAARQAAAMMVVLREFDVPFVQGVPLTIGEGEITFTPNVQAPVLMPAQEA